MVHDAFNRRRPAGPPDIGASSLEVNGRSPMEEKLGELLLDVLNVRLSELDGDQKITDLEEWDSLKHVEFVLGLEREFGFELTGDEIAGLATVDDVRRIVLARSTGSGAAAFSHAKSTLGRELDDHLQ